MRPQILFPLFAPVTSLAGVGPKLAALLGKVAGATVADLCWHLPYGLVDRRFTATVAAAPEDRVVTIAVRIRAHRPPASPRQPYRVLAEDATGSLTLVFFHPNRGYLAGALPPGEERLVSGRLERFRGEAQMVHPDAIGRLDEMDEIGTVEPLYHATAGLHPKALRRAVRAALDAAPELPEWLDPALCERHRWPDWRTALHTAHAPASEAELAPTTAARMRLAYDELLASQLALGLVRLRARRAAAPRIAAAGALAARAEAALPYRLTHSQRAALADIRADMASGGRMMRLLQGDVGSGKTVVAALAMLDAVEAGGQAVLMAPTDLLARQHHATVAAIAAAADIRLALLTGRDKGRARAALVDHIARGDVPLVVGTHALFQEDVAFRRLLLAVVDEQHRFGVEERMRLADKGEGTHLLAMTATPIPRTLMLAAYGDLDSSRLTEKPPGRVPVDTRVLPLDRLEEVVAALGRALAGGAKAYWVCPLIEDSEAVDFAAAEARFAALRSAFGERVGLVHGRMKPADRDRVMAAFATGDVDVLVATTVIEVGVDVAAATLIVIEQAERFGLAQLHQLRGRVGRGNAGGRCLLLYRAPLGETARRRLATLRDTDDGFVIAEEDLRLRGAGEVLGTRQSGLPEFRLADLGAHADLLAVARRDADSVLARDPGLATPRGVALRALLYLFRRDAAIGYVRAG